MDTDLEIEAVDAAWEAARQARRAVNVSTVSAIVNSVIITVALFMPVAEKIHDSVEEADKLKTTQIAAMTDGVAAMETVDSLFKSGGLLNVGRCVERHHLDEYEKGQLDQALHSIVEESKEHQSVMISDATTADLRITISNLAADVSISDSVMERQDLRYYPNDIHRKMCIGSFEKAVVGYNELKISMKRTYDNYLSPIRDPYFGLPIHGTERPPFTIMEDGGLVELNALIQKYSK